MSESPNEARSSELRTAASTSLSRGLFLQIARALRDNVAVDLGSCRHDLALRALGRRLRARQQASLKSYAQLIGEDPVEPRRLARCLLPSEGDVFLDHDGAAVLSLRLVATRTQGEVPRLWVPECGEGEEVFALALRVHSLLQPEPDAEAPSFFIYGTESDAGALELAESGLLSAPFIEQIPARLKRDFIQSLSYGAKVQPGLMQHCQFHPQYLLSPPPAQGVDVISGRNILRFCSEPERAQLLAHWHAALKPGGLLILGPGETVKGHAELFAPKPLANGIYLKQAERVWTPTEAAAAPRAGREVDIHAYRQAFASSLRPSALLDAGGFLLDVNAAFAQVFELDPAVLCGQSLQSLCAAADREALAALLAQPVEERDEAAHALEVSLRRPSGTQPMRLRINLHTGHAIRAQVELEPIEGVAAMAASESFGLQAALELMSEGLMLCDSSGRIQLLNTVAQRLTGWSHADASARLANDVLRVVSPMGERLLSPVDDCLHSQLPSALTGQQAQLVARDGRRIAIDLKASPVPMADGSTGCVLLFEDVSQKLLLSEELAWRSTHDPVTGLLNRDEFELRVRSALSRARHGTEQSVVCMIDIDQFRLINDVLGHSAGDELLHELAGELRVRLREGDVLARLSGDEFGVLLIGSRLVEVEGIVRSLIEAVRTYRFEWLDRKHAVTISIGVAQIDASTDSVGRVLSLADAACHAAKAAGRDRARFMGRDDEAQLHHSQMGMVGQIGRAIEDGRLFLLCEDVMQVSSPSTVVYRELLVRLRDEDGNLVKPAHFVPAAERYFMMNALDRWVAREAFTKLAKLPDHAHRGIVYAINVSGQSMSDPEFLAYVTDEIVRTGVDPVRLCFELTETAAIARLTDASRFVAKLTELGCRFALDDFGVGMSSFGYLKNFPVHFLKIDGSFVRSMRDSQIDRRMVETINRIGHQLGLKTIAEHVESLELIEPLKAMGVDWAQGYGLSPARPFDEVLQLK